MTRLPSLAGLRFPLAFLVFLTHAWYISGILPEGAQQDAMRAIMPLAMASLSCFFVISGFVLTWSFRPGDTTGFWRRRAAKVYPSHIVVLALFLLIPVSADTGLVAAESDEPPSAAATVASFLLVHAWVPEREFNAGLNIVTWSLAVEVFCYALLPFILPLLLRTRPERLWAVGGSMIAVIWLIPGFALLFDGPEIPEVGASQWHFWIPYMLPLARLPEFVIGAVIALLLRHGRRAPVGMCWSAVLVLLSLGTGALLLPFPYVLVAATAVPVALLVFATASADVHGGKSWLRRPVPVFLGTISFAFYLVHWPVIVAISHLLGHRSWELPQALAVSALFTGCSLLLAWLLYRIVEAPLTRRLGRPQRRSEPGGNHGDPDRSTRTASAPGVHPAGTAQVPVPEHDGGQPGGDGLPARGV